MSKIVEHDRNWSQTKAAPKVNHWNVSDRFSLQELIQVALIRTPHSVAFELCTQRISTIAMSRDEDMAWRLRPTQRLEICGKSSCRRLRRRSTRRLWNSNSQRRQQRRDKMLEQFVRNKELMPACWREGGQTVKLPTEVPICSVTCTKRN